MSQLPAYFFELQDRICRWVRDTDPNAGEQQDSWDYEGGGGGRTVVFSEGAIFERAGVNYSKVFGSELPPSIIEEFPEAEGEEFMASGISLVFHPLNPYVPTVHMNYRYFDAGDVWWAGGGADLTPYYPLEEDVVHFHRTLKEVCDRHDPEYYRRFKEWCDSYFYIEHREEPRGVGGIFFDYLQGEYNKISQFVRDCGDAFIPSYKPIVDARKGTGYGQRQREFQLYRRGRYVEFNLVYDRGTKFGLETGGRIESILMSMPPLVRWKYDYQPEPGSPEAELYEKYLHPRDWV